MQRQRLRCNASVLRRTSTPLSTHGRNRMVVVASSARLVAQEPLADSRLALGNAMSRRRRTHACRRQKLLFPCWYRKLKSFVRLFCGVRRVTMRLRSAIALQKKAAQNADSQIGTCQHVLLRGARRGQQCARPCRKENTLYCSAHASRYAKQTLCQPERHAVAEEPAEKAAFRDTSQKTMSSMEAKKTVDYRLLTSQQNEALLLARLRELQTALAPSLQRMKLIQKQDC